MVQRFCRRVAEGSPKGRREVTVDGWCSMLVYRLLHDGERKILPYRGKVVLLHLQLLWKNGTETRYKIPDL